MINIPFELSWKKIAVSVSGGADSALLAFLLCDKISKNNNNIEVHIISHVRCWKTKPWQKYDGLNVYNYLINKFPNITFFRHENFIPPEMEWGDIGPTIIDEYGKLVSGDNVELRSFAEYTCYHNNIDVYFNAVTRNPKEADFKGMVTRDIDPTEENSHLEYMNHMGKIAAHPFRFIEKKYIISEYKKQNIVDLLKITRSCEGVFDNINYTNYIPYQEVPICNKCFWCKERQWAIDNAE